MNVVIAVIQQTCWLGGGNHGRHFMLDRVDNLFSSLIVCFILGCTISQSATSLRVSSYSYGPYIYSMLLFLCISINPEFLFSINNNKDIPRDQLKTVLTMTELCNQGYSIRSQQVAYHRPHQICTLLKHRTINQPQAGLRCFDRQTEVTKNSLLSRHIRNANLEE